MSGASTSGMSWLNVIAPMAPTVGGGRDDARGTALLGQRAAIAHGVASTNPNAPAALSSTISVGCSRNDSSVVPASVVTIDSSDHA